MVTIARQEEPRPNRRGFFYVRWPHNVTGRQPFPVEREATGTEPRSDH